MSEALTVSDFISQKYRIKVLDGRIFQGTLVSVDDQSNLLMTDVTEFYKDDFTGELQQRRIGPINVPRSTIKEIQINKADYNGVVKWKQAQKAKVGQI